MGSPNLNLAISHRHMEVDGVSSTCIQSASYNCYCFAFQKRPMGSQTDVTVIKRRFTDEDLSAALAEAFEDEIGGKFRNV